MSHLPWRPSGFQWSGASAARTDRRIPGVLDKSPWQRLSSWGKTGVVVALTATVGAAGTALWGFLARSVDEQFTPPVQVSVQVDPSYWASTRPNWTPYFYWIPAADPVQLSRPPEDCRERRDWTFGQGAADADETRVTFTLRGARSAEVSLEEMRVEVDSREAIAGGIVAACPVGGATGEIRGLEVDLDAETVEYVDAGESAPSRITLTEGETEAFDVYARTSVPGQVVNWWLVLTAVDGENRVPIVIDDGGAPLRTAGTVGVPMVVWESERWATYEP